MARLCCSPSANIQLVYAVHSTSLHEILNKASEVSFNRRPNNLLQMFSGCFLSHRSICTPVVIPVLNTKIQLTVFEIHHHFWSRVLGDLHAFEIRLLFKFHYRTIDTCHPLENVRMVY